MNKNSNNSVVFFIPETKFHDLEFSITKSILEKAKIKVFISSESRNLSIGHFGLRIKPDIYLYNIHPENFKGIVLIGGEGTRNYWKNDLLIKIIKNFHYKGKIVAAICSAVGILASAELLKGKKVTCYLTDLELIKSSGAMVTRNLVEIDHNIITASGPEAAELFGKILSEIINKELR